MQMTFIEFVSVSLLNLVEFLHKLIFIFLYLSKVFISQSKKAKFSQSDLLKLIGMNLLLFIQYQILVIFEFNLYSTVKFYLFLSKGNPSKLHVYI